MSYDFSTALLPAGAITHVLFAQCMQRDDARNVDIYPEACALCAVSAIYYYVLSSGHQCIQPDLIGRDSVVHHSSAIYSLKPAMHFRYYLKLCCLS